MPNVKDGVVFWPGIVQRLQDDQEIIDRVHVRIAGRPSIITSARDGKHSQRSKHYVGKALDYRSHDLTHKEKWRVLQRMRAELGSDYDVLLEDENGPNEHFHLELDPD